MNLGERRLNAMILLRSLVRQILLIVLHEGGKIESYQSKDLINFQVIEGKFKLNVRKNAQYLNKVNLSHSIKK